MTIARTLALLLLALVSAACAESTTGPGGPGGQEVRGEDALAWDDLAAAHDDGAVDPGHLDDGPATDLAAAGDTTAPDPGQAPVPDAAAAELLPSPRQGLVINELRLVGDDWVELANPTALALDLSGLRVADLGDDGAPKLDEALEIPAGTTLEPGAYLLIAANLGDRARPGLQTDCAPGVATCLQAPWGLSAGNGDAVFVVDAEDRLVTSAEAPPDAAPDGRTWARLPDGAGDFAVATPTPGLPNRPPASAAVNEVNPVGDDWFELFGAGVEPLDLSGWRLADADADGQPRLEEALTVPNGVTLAPGAWLVVRAGLGADARAGVQTACVLPGVATCLEAAFGLGAKDGDAVFLLDPDGHPIEAAAFPAGAVAEGQTWARLPDGQGPFGLALPTPGAANAPLR